MYSTITMSARLCALLFIFLFCSTAFAGSTKVEVCHIPPDNPDNYHTIKINEKALAAHLAHFDLVGACNDVCATLCDDGDACTIDDSGDCEQNGCPVISEPVDCSDGNLCTDDICDSGSGCSNPVAVTCEAPDLCTSSTCDPNAGVCEETPVMCDEGEVCDPESGACVDDTPPPNSCPCFNLAELQTGGTIAECGENFPANPVTIAAIYDDSVIACSGENCVEEGTLGCSYISVVSPISVTENYDCGTLILQNCPDPN